MKRTVTQYGLAVAMVWALCAAGTAQAAQGTAVRARISSLNGTVELRKAGKDQWTAAKLDQKLGAGDRIRTGKDAKVALTLSAGNTVELHPDTELAVQRLQEDGKSHQYEYLLGIPKGKLTAKLAPIPVGSKVEFQTPLSTIHVPSSAEDPTFTLAVNSDGSVTVESSDGTIQTIRETSPSFSALLDSGKQALVEYDSTAGAIRVTGLAGPFNITGPGGKVFVLNTGDSVLFLASGAATFIPAESGVDSPVAGAFEEPVSGS